MDWTVFFLSVFVGLGLPWCAHAASVPREYHYIDQPMNWADARQYCREEYTDLATLDSMDDARRLKRPKLSTDWNWIGLTDDPASWKGIMGGDANSWRWSVTGNTSVNGYQNWRPGQPDQENVDYACMYVDVDGKWADLSCETSMYFVCYDEDLKDKVYTLIQNNLTWWEAQTYCRANHSDLAMIENDEENSRMLSATSSQYAAWTGLYRILWRWCDKTALSFRNWVPSQPNSGTNCVAENSYHQWNDLGCDSKYNFWCHGALKVKQQTMVRMKILTKADLSNPATNAEILQQLSAALTRQGLTDFKLRWNIPPEKQKKLTESQCPING